MRPQRPKKGDPKRQRIVVTISIPPDCSWQGAARIFRLAVFEEALRWAKGNRSLAARRLHIDRVWLWRVFNQDSREFARAVKDGVQIRTRTIDDQRELEERLGAKLPTITKMRSKREWQRELTRRKREKATGLHRKAK